MVLKTCLSAFDLELPLNISCCSTISSWRETPFCDQVMKFHGLFILPTSPYSRLNLRNYFLMRKAQLCFKQNMSPKHYINRYKQQKWTLWNCCANTFSKTTIAICFNPLQISPSIFKFAERFILFEQLLLFFTQFGDNSLRLNFDKFRYTPFNQRNVSFFLIAKSRPEVEVCQNLWVLCKQSYLPLSPPYCLKPRDCL